MGIQMRAHVAVITWLRDECSSWRWGCWGVEHMDLQRLGGGREGYGMPWDLWKETTVERSGSCPTAQTGGVDKLWLGRSHSKQAPHSLIGPRSRLHYSWLTAFSSCLHGSNASPINRLIDQLLDPPHTPQNLSRASSLGPWLQNCSWLFSSQSKILPQPSTNSLRPLLEDRNYTPPSVRRNASKGTSFFVLESIKRH